MEDYLYNYLCVALLLQLVFMCDTQVVNRGQISR